MQGSTLWVGLHETNQANFFTCLTWKRYNRRFKTEFTILSDVQKAFVYFFNLKIHEYAPLLSKITTW